MRVLDYINQVEPADVIAAYAERYDDPPDLETWFRFRDEVNARVLVKSDMSVLLRHVEEKWSEHPGCGDDEEYIDVSGIDPDGATWSMSFIDWSDWKGMAVIDDTGLALSPAQIAAHLFYEMTWHGFPEDAIARRDEVFHRMEEVTRALGIGDEDVSAGPSRRDGEAPATGPKS